jgi:hypothetical protein
MIRFLLVILLLFGFSAADAQAILSGTVLDAKNRPVPRANVYLDNTLDGGTSDSTGHFKFSTGEKGAQTLVATAVGYENGGLPVTIDGNLSDLVVHLKGSAQALDGVTVTAGFEAGADKNKAILTTLDIITTAGSNADVVRAIQTLPGTQQQGTQTGLFVRGGDASEAAIVIDGLIAQDAFFTGAPGVATRSRFSPFQFKGVSFSSGGYSARYGQALSSVLELNTLDLPDKSNVNLGLNMAGIYASGSRLWKNSAIEGTAYYNNLAPFYGLAKTNLDFYDVPKGGGGSGRYTWKPSKDGILKVMASGTYTNSGVRIPNPDSPGRGFDYGIQNTNYLASVSYRQNFKSKWSLFTAASYTENHDKIDAGGTPLENRNDRAQLRIEAKRYLLAKLNVTLGGELQHFSFRKAVTVIDTTYHLDFTETQTAGYLEVDWSPAYWIAIRPGVRAEHSDLLNENTISPRLAIALRAGQHGQITLSGGSFYQLPDAPYLQFGYRPSMQQAIHYIGSYQWIKGDRTLRLEAYYKDYRSLVREKVSTYDPNSFRYFYNPADNSGYGYAKGAELFWRDRKLIKNFDYWISYSYIDTRRLFRNFLTEATPDFISDHNANFVGKYYIPKWTTQINATYSFATGRPYYNPLRPVFLGDRTPAYNNLSVTVNYLTNIKKWFTVVYAGVDNVTNRKNIFGYRYSADGTAYPQYPALFRSFFVGANFSLTEFNKDEL